MAAGAGGLEPWPKLKSGEERGLNSGRSVKTPSLGSGGMGTRVMVQAIELRARSPVEMGPEQKWVGAGIGYSLGHLKDHMGGMNGWNVV